jgi:hypothetical protein
LNAIAMMCRRKVDFAVRHTQVVATALQVLFVRPWIGRLASSGIVNHCNCNCLGALLAEGVICSYPVAEFVEEFLLNGPETISALSTEFTLNVAFEIVLDAVVFEQRVVHIHQEDDCVRKFHKAVPAGSVLR